VDVSDAELENLRDRLRGTRWATPWPVGPWEAGTDGDELRRLVDYWASAYDWRKHEAAINALPSRFADIDGTPVHYLRFDAERGGALPLLLANGWPSSFLELAGLADRLSAPSRYGGTPEKSYTVIIPTLPGFGLSPQRPALDEGLLTHEIWHRLMHDVLGFERYGAHGSDLGAGECSLLAQTYPEAVVGVHLLDAADPPSFDPTGLTVGSSGPTMSPAIRPCPVGDISPPTRNRACSPTTSAPSSKSWPDALHPEDSAPRR
jgi:pimeloyl-ACP methyl ester carboxylesterase